MKQNKTLAGIFLLAILASLGVALIYLPPKVVEQFEMVERHFGRTGVYIYFGIVGSGAALLFGISLWTIVKLWRRTRKKAALRAERNKNPSELTAAQRRQEIEDNLEAVDELQSGDATSPELKQHLGPLAQRIEDKRETQKLEIVAFGTISSGKSAVLNALAGRDIFRSDAKGGTTVERNEIPWPGNDQVFLVDTPGLGEVDGAERVAIAAHAAKDADLVLLVVDGPLRESEFTLLARLGQMEKRVLVCLNKSDWYEPEDLQKLRGQLARQVQEFVAGEDVVTVRAQPGTRARVRILPDGREQSEDIPLPPDISPRADRMLKVVRREGTSLLLANLLLQSRGLVDEARRRVQQDLDRRAWSIVDKYMWGAGGAAALSHFPRIDLVVGCAISTHMGVDLAAVYRQEMDLNSATRLLGEMGKNLVSAVGAGVAAPAVAAAIGSLIKSVPGIGTVSGQMLTGIVQAVVTRWIGAVFIEYFKNEMQQPAGGLAGLARREWERVTSLNELRQIAMQARQRLAGKESTRQP